MRLLIPSRLLGRFRLSSPCKCRPKKPDRCLVNTVPWVLTYMLIHGGLKGHNPLTILCNYVVGSLLGKPPTLALVGLGSGPGGRINIIESSSSSSFVRTDLIY